MAANTPMLTTKALAEMTPAPPVKVAGGAPIVTVVPFDSAEVEVMAAQVLKF